MTGPVTLGPIVVYTCTGVLEDTCQQYTCCLEFAGAMQPIFIVND